MVYIIFLVHSLKTREEKKEEKQIGAKETLLHTKYEEAKQKEFQ